MKLERPKPTVFRLTLHAFELSALIAAARWVEEGAEGDLPSEARDHLRKVLASYDEESRRLSGGESHSSHHDDDSVN